MADQSDRLHQIPFLNVCERNLIDPDFTGSLSELSGQQAGDSTFSTAGYTHKGDETSGRNRHRDFTQYRFFHVVGKCYMAKIRRNRTVGKTLCSVCFFLHVQNPKNLIACGHTVHGNVEERTEQPQRNKKFRSKQDHCKGPRKIHGAVTIFEDGDDHTDGGSPVCDDIHDTDRIELHSQYFHGDFSETLCLQVHFISFAAVRLVNLERRKSLKIFQETVAKFCINSPIFVQQLFGEFLHSYNGNRDQRNADQKYETGFPTDET